ncbi:MAG: glycerol-3-phosphate 1-O-acyltransferase PlsY [Ruthenibacterium sp.]
MLPIILCGIASAACGYLIGSLSFAIIVTKWLYHKDIRTFGSGNAGMTNVLRTFGKGAAALTLAGDIGKGVAAVFLAKAIFAAFTTVNPIYGAYLAAFFAVIGHIYPLYFEFKGGKAVSVATGTIVAIEPILVLPLLVLFILVFACSKMVSLASICAAIAYPIVTFLYFNHAGHDVVLTTCCAAVIGALVLWMHRSNIKRIAAGTEYKFGQKKDK